MAFVSGISVSVSRSTFTGCRVTAKVVPSTVRWTMMAKSKAIPFLDAPPKLDGTMVGDVGFDPFGFSNGVPLAWLREAEIKHGRICMLAVLGFIVQELYTFPFYAGAPSLPVPAHDYFVKFGSLGQILLFTSLFEIVVGFPAIQQTLQGSARTAGDYGFDPLKLGKDKTTLARYQLSELKHGRLCMIVIGAFIHQYWLTKMGVIGQLTSGKFLP